MADVSFVCEAHSSEASCFCLCSTPYKYLCESCTEKHGPGHEVYPMALLGLFKVVPPEEVRRRYLAYQASQGFLNGLISQEATRYAEAQGLIAAITQAYQRLIEQNHNCFCELVQVVSAETQQPLWNQSYKVSPISQRLLEQSESLSEIEAEIFAFIPYLESLELLNGQLKADVARSKRVFQTEYEAKVLSALTQARPMPPQPSLNSIKKAANIGPLPDYQTETTKSALAQFGVYPEIDLEESIVRREAVMLEDASGEGMYTGQWNGRNQRHGFGVQVWKGGKMYEGEWRRDKVCGKGRMVFKNGDVYIGEWADGKMSGYGTYHYTTGTSYTGQWLNDKKNGFGSYQTKSNDIHFGCFSNGQRNGLGAYFFNSGAIFAGHYRDGSATGHGIESYSNGEMYMGEFLSNQKNGLGCYIYSSGKVYRGHFLSSQKSGSGRMTDPGDYYEGEFANNKKNGHGVWKGSDGVVRPCEFLDDKKVK